MAVFEGAKRALYIHYASFLVTLVMLVCDYVYMHLPTHQTYAGRFKYLTFQSFLVGLMYYNVASVFDFVIYTRERDSELFASIRDFLFTTIVFPLAMFVCAMFWLLYTVNPTFLRSPEEEKLVPWWMNHGYHTLPIALALFQAYAIHHSYPRKRMALISIVAVDGLYIIWLFYVAYHANIWVYPFMAKMSMFGVLLFLAICVALSFGCYYLGKKFTDFVWRNEKAKSE